MACEARGRSPPAEMDSLPLLKCIMHVEPATTNPCERLTEARWDTFRRSARDWDKTSVGSRESDIVRECLPFLDQTWPDMPLNFGFHPSCYRRFIDKKRINSALKRAEKPQTMKRPASQENVSTMTPKRTWRLRSTISPLMATSQNWESKHVLPPICLICKTFYKYMTRQGKRVQDKLIQAETESAGLLCEAAEAKSDQHILHHIRGKDCVAIEVKYHQTCYREYTRFLSKKEKDTERPKSTKQQYIRSYKTFCDEVVRGRIINGQEIIRMKKLLDLFVKTVQKEEAITLKDYRADQLKYFLRQDFPQLNFHKPSKRNTSEMVFTDTLGASDLLEHLPCGSTFSTESSDSEQTTESGENVPDSQDIPGHVHLECTRTLYSAGLIVHQSVKDSPEMAAQWPPTSCDFTIDKANAIVPLELYNLIAWCTGSSDELLLNCKVSVPENVHCKLLSICQDIIYLTFKGRKTTPKSLSVGLAVRHLTGSSQVLQMLNHLGHCASSDTIIGFETGLAQLQLMRQDKVPYGMDKNKHTTLVWDNIDFGEETLSGRGTTHHTNGIMVQKEIHHSHTTKPQIPKGARTLKPRPSHLGPYHLTKRHGPANVSMESPMKNVHLSQHVKASQMMDFAFTVMKYANNEEGVLPGWTGFNTVLSKNELLPKSSIYYLPVIEASPTDMTTVNEIFQRSLEIADLLNLNYVVLVFDQAIYAKAQQIRWKDEALRKKCVVRLGEFHTSMSFLGILGKRFKEAGLQDLLIESEVVAQGSINGVMSGHHYNRSVRAHKMVYEAMEILRFREFLMSLPDEKEKEYLAVIDDLVSEYPTDTVHTIISSSQFTAMMGQYSSFIDEMKEANPTFAFWSSYIEMVGQLLVFIRATRDSDWTLHLAATRHILPWYFAYDRMNYSRYLPAYWIEMLDLPSTHTDCHEEFLDRGSWTVQRQDRYNFSAIACDQAIEQTCNRDSKTNGGITGITLNRGAVQRWILSQPERAAITRQCEVMAGMTEDVRSRKDLDLARMKKDNKAVNNIISTIESMINPFTPNDSLVSISSGAVATPEVKESLLKSLDSGEKALETYINDRLLSDKEDLFSPIKSLKLKTFADLNKKSSKSKSGREIVWKNDCRFFKRLLIVSQSRDLDLREVLSFSLGSVSLPLASVDGSLAKTNKALLLQTLEKKAGDCTVHPVQIPGPSALMIDGMALIQSLRNIPATFGALADQLLQEVIRLARLYQCTRVDFVTDRYPDISIKNVERSRRAQAGSQVITIYGNEQKTPAQWKKFLSSGVNKERLTAYLYSAWKDAALELAGDDLHLYVTHGDECHEIRVVCGQKTFHKVDALTCDHEEADTRLLLHASHASHELYSSVIILSPDTDVAVIALCLLSKLPSSKLYFLTGKQAKHRIINLRKMSDVLGPDLCLALIGLHTFTGCDTTSAFYGKGKKTTFSIASENVDYLHVFSLVGDSFAIDRTAFQTLERYVCQLYGEKCSDVNEARYRTFCTKTPSEFSLPPTKDALEQHYRRANYQAAIHRRSLQQMIEAPSPDGHGWILEVNDLKIQWMTNDPAPESIMSYVHCGCKAGHCESGRCSCLRAKLCCTDLCKCVTCNNKKENEEEIFVDQVASDDEGDSDFDELL